MVKMNKSLFIVLFLGLGLASGSVDLKRSVDRIKDQINLAWGTTIYWDRLPGIIKMILPCLSSLSSFEVKSGGLPSGLKQYIEHFTPEKFAQELLLVDWEEVSAKAESATPTEFEDDLKDFMQTPTFEKLHNQLWNNDEFKDLVGYIYTANYPQLYTTIIQFYEDMGRSDLTANIPTGPPTYPASQTLRKASTSSKATSSNFPLISIKSSVFKKDDPNCDELLPTLAKAVEELNASGVHQVIKILLYTIQELIGNAAMHILLLKVGEPQKGAMFHDFLAQPDVQNNFQFIRGMVLNTRPITQLNEILRQVTGLDIGNPDLFQYLVNLIEYLVWNYPFPTQ
jgi:thiol-disulfide isomerase/thioredoxin